MRQRRGAPTQFGRCVSQCRLQVKANTLPFHPREQGGHKRSRLLSTSLPQRPAAAAAIWRRCDACRACTASLVAGKVGMRAASLGSGCSENQGCSSASAQLMRFSCTKTGEERGGGWLEPRAGARARHIRLHQADAGPAAEPRLPHRAELQQASQQVVASLAERGPAVEAKACRGEALAQVAGWVLAQVELLGALQLRQACQKGGGGGTGAVARDGRGQAEHHAGRRRRVFRDCSMPNPWLLRSRLRRGQRANRRACTRGGSAAGAPGQVCSVGEPHVFRIMVSSSISLLAGNSASLLRGRRVVRGGEAYGHEGDGFRLAGTAGPVPTHLSRCLPEPAPPPHPPSDCLPSAPTPPTHTPPPPPTSAALP